MLQTENNLVYELVKILKVKKKLNFLKIGKNNKFEPLKTKKKN